MIHLNKLMSFSVRSILGYRSLSKHIITADGKDVPKDKTAKQNRITLINSDKSITITDLKSAQNVSLRRDLKLVKIQDVDAKTRRPIYKLVNMLTLKLLFLQTLGIYKYSIIIMCL